MLLFEPSEIQLAAQQVLDCHVRQALLESNFKSSMTEGVSPATILLTMFCGDVTKCPRLLGAIEVVCLFIGVKFVGQEPGYDGAGLFFATMDNDACSFLFRRVQKL